MMNVLDMLKYRLSAGDRGTSQLDPVVQDMIRGNLGRSLPPGLPLGVQDSIRNRPSYGEGEIMAPEPWWIPSLGGQMQKEGPQRENTLLFDRQEALRIPNPGVPVDPWSKDQPEGGVWSSRPPGVSPYASPLNQLMELGRRAPLSLY
jgi:hypothetical protein